MGKYATVNEALKAYYASKGHTDLFAYVEWQMQGFQVKKGEKALMLWSAPLKLKSAKDEQGNEVESVNNYQIHGVKNVFSNLQVEKIADLEAGKPTRQAD